MKDKSKVLKTYRDKLQFICLIGGRVCNPRQQHTLNIYLKSLSDYKQLAAAAGYKPAPQLTRPPIRQTN